MNILVCGGYNWLTYELINRLLNHTSIRSIVIYDNFDYMNSMFSSIFENKCQEKMESYKYLYNDFIHIINGDCKDKDKLDRIYKDYKISCVLNNIKYNYRKTKEENEILLQYHKHIIELNIQYNITKYISIFRYYTHKHIHLYSVNYDIINHSKQLYDSIIVLQDKMNPDYIYNIDYKDYLYGDKITHNTNIYYKYYYIHKIGSGTFIYKDTFYISKDDEQIETIIDILSNKIHKHYISLKTKKYTYNKLVECILKDKKMNV